MNYSPFTLALSLWRRSSRPTFTPQSLAPEWIPLTWIDRITLRYLKSQSSEFPKKPLLLTVIAVCLLASPGSVQAAVIDFDDFSTTTGVAIISDGYKGLDWNNFAVINKNSYHSNSGYNAGTVSGSYTALNGGANPSSFSSSTPFSIQSGIFTAAWNNGLNIGVTGWLNGTQTHSTSFTVDAAGSNIQKQVNFNWSNIDEVRFSSSGGTAEPSYDGAGKHFALDNVVLGLDGGGNWLNTTSSNHAWSTGSNWGGGAQPTSADDAVFDLSGTYNVGFAADAVAKNIEVSAGRVVLDMAGHNLDLSGHLRIGEGGGSVQHVATIKDGAVTSTGTGFHAVGIAGSTASLVIDNSTVDLNGNQRMSVGSAGNSSGLLLIDNGSHVASEGDLYLGDDSSDRGFLNIENGSSLQVDRAIVVGDGGIGEFNIRSGSSVTANELVVGKSSMTNGRGSVVIGGNASVELNRFLVSNGQPTDAYRGSGSITLSDGGRLKTVAKSILRGPTSGRSVLQISGGEALLDGGLDVRLGGVVELSDGLLRTGSLNLEDGAGGLDWTGGTLELVGGTLEGLPTLTAPSGGVLMGSGIIDAEVVVASDGVVAPGSSPGTLSITGDLTTAPGSITQIEIDGTASGSFDRLIVTGDYNAGGTVQVALGYNPTNGDSFDVVDWGGSVNDYALAYDFSEAALAPGLSWDTSEFLTSGTLTVIPEPATMGLLGLAGLALLGRRGKRARATAGNRGQDPVRSAAARCPQRGVVVALAAGVVLGIGFASPGRAATINWTGDASNAWGSTGNWSPADVPDSNDTARIGVGDHTIDFVNGSDTVSNLIVEDIYYNSAIFGSSPNDSLNATLNLPSGSQLNILDRLRVGDDQGGGDEVNSFVVSGGGRISMQASSTSVVIGTSAPGSYSRDRMSIRDGAEVDLNDTAYLVVGSNAGGELKLFDGASVTAAKYIAIADGSTATNINYSSLGVYSGSSVSTSGYLRVGDGTNSGPNNNVYGSLLISDGGLVTADEVSAGTYFGTGSEGARGFISVSAPNGETATLSGENMVLGGRLSGLTAVSGGEGHLRVGNHGLVDIAHTVHVVSDDDIITIESGGTLNAATLRSGGRIFVDGAASFDAQTVTHHIGTVGKFSQVTVDSTGSLDFLHAKLSLGRSAGSVGTLNLYQNGNVHVGSELRIAEGVGSVGTLNVDGPGALLTTDSTLIVGDQGTEATLNITRGTANVGGDLSLALGGSTTGTVNLTGGTLDMQGNTVGVHTGSGVGSFNFTGGTLRNVGSIDGLNQQGGTLQIGNSPGVMNVVGDYTLAAGATLEIEIDGTPPGSFDRLIVTGEFDAEGTVNVVLGYGAANGDSFDVVDWGSVNAFADPEYVFTGTALASGLSWDTSEFLTSGTLTVIPEPATLGLFVVAGFGLLRRRNAIAARRVA